MSDIAQANGWWQATDGKWYPPPAANSQGAQMTQWRVTPSGERQYLSEDGNWYVSDQVEAPPARPAGVPAHAAAPGVSTVPAGAWLAIIGGLIIGVSSFLPWLTATALIVTINRNGFQLGNDFGFSADGVVCIILGVVAVIIGVVRLTNSASPPLLQRSPIILGIAAAAVFANRYGSLHNFANQLNSHADVTASVGYGFWLLAIGAFVAIVSGLILRSNSSKPAAQAQ